MPAARGRAVNRFPDDTPAGLEKILQYCANQQVRAAPYEAFAKGPEGAAEPVTKSGFT